MTIDIGARRAARNQRRKVVVAEKRKAELEAKTPPARSARRWPGPSSIVWYSKACSALAWAWW